MDWQERYESGDTPWDKGDAAPAISQFLAEKPFLFSENSRIAVPGCGVGHDSMLLAENGCSVLGLDIAPLAVSRARELAPRWLDLEYQVVDLLGYDGPLSGCFELIWEHTCYCALPLHERSRYVKSMWNLLKQDGYLAGVFFIDPTADPTEGPPFMSSMGSVESVFREQFELVWSAVPNSSYAGREGKELLMLFKRVGL